MKAKKVSRKVDFTHPIVVFSVLGEIYELKAELNSDKRDRKKEAVKKVILPSARFRTPPIERRH